jgi:GDP-L-fucose synthase
MKRKILVCGASGFIGRNIAESLAENDEFEIHGTYLSHAPDSDSKVVMKRVDLTEKNEVNRALQGTDIVIQAAAVTSGAQDIITRPYIHVTDNAIMNSLIFRAAYEYKVSHVFYFSCGAIYQSSDVPAKETDFDANQEIYPSYFGIGWTKVYIEKMCEFYSRIGNTRYTVLRHSNIYGPYDKFDLERSHVFGATITKVLTAKNNGKIIVWGSGEEERDLLYVSDLVNFVKLAIEKHDSKFGLYNVGYGSAISVNDLVKKIIAHSGNIVSIEHDLSRPSIKTKFCLDTTRAYQYFGWSPRVSLDEGIQKTIDWYRKNNKT